jgi:ketosteroid isomerase-like protein
VIDPPPEQAEVLRDYFDAFNRRDVEAWVDLNHPDVEMVLTPYWAPAGTSYSGHAGVRTYAHEMFQRLPYLHSEVAELRDLGDRVLGRGTVAFGQDQASAGARSMACLFMLKDGKVYRVEIPIVGRIVAVADVFDALTHDRPYKTAWPTDRAVAEVLGMSGRQFDPAVVEAFSTLDHEILVGRLRPGLASAARGLETVS